MPCWCKWESQLPQVWQWWYYYQEGIRCGISSTFFSLFPLASHHCGSPANCSCRLGNLSPHLKPFRFYKNRFRLLVTVCMHQLRHCKCPLGSRTLSPSIGLRIFWPNIREWREKVSHYQRSRRYWKAGSRRMDYAFITSTWWLKVWGSIYVQEMCLHWVCFQDLIQLRTHPLSSSTQSFWVSLGTDGSCHTVLGALRRRSPLLCTCKPQQLSAWTLCQSVQGTSCNMWTLWLVINSKLLFRPWSSIVMTFCPQNVHIVESDWRA